MKFLSKKYQYQNKNAFLNNRNGKLNINLNKQKGHFQKR
jgi:hypothetical protein